MAAPLKAGKFVRNIKGQLYHGPVIFKVLKWDEFNRPSEVVIGYDDSTFDLKGGEHFFTGYIDASAVRDAVDPKAKS